MRTTASRVQAWLLLGFCLLANVLYQRQNPPPRLDMVDLGTPPPAMMVRTAALGENAFAGYLVMQEETEDTAAHQDPQTTPLDTTESAVPLRQSR